MCFWVSRTLNAQHDAGWHHRGFLVFLPCSCAAPPLQLLSARVVCHQAVRWVTLPEGCLEPAGRVCCLQPAGGMQHNLLDLPEWPQVNLHRGKAAHISPVHFKRGPRLHLLWSALAECHRLKSARKSRGGFRQIPLNIPPLSAEQSPFPRPRGEASPTCLTAEGVGANWVYRLPTTPIKPTACSPGKQLRSTP